MNMHCAWKKLSTNGRTMKKMSFAVPVITEESKRMRGKMRVFVGRDAAAAGGKEFEHQKSKRARVVYLDLGKYRS